MIPGLIAALTWGIYVGCKLKLTSAVPEEEMELLLEQNKPTHTTTTVTQEGIAPPVIVPPTVTQAVVTPPSIEPPTGL